MEIAHEPNDRFQRGCSMPVRERGAWIDSLHQRGSGLSVEFEEAWNPTGRSPGCQRRRLCND
jgi:hypothetical protein